MVLADEAAGGLLADEESGAAELLGAAVDWPRLAAKNLHQILLKIITPNL